jgi:hypothetical protein
MPVTIDGSNGITTPMYNGSITANAVTPSVNMKNRLINSAMVIDQRNAGASTTPAGSTYTLDRWVYQPSPASKFSIQRSTTAPGGFSNSMLLTVVSAYTPSGNDSINIGQYIEGFNVADLGWGTANAKTVTLSFWVNCSVTGTYSVQFGGDNGRGYIGTYTVSAANTWEYKTITVPGDTSGTYGTTNGTGITVFFALGAGSGRQNTANTWIASGYTTTAATGSTNLVATNGATLYITGVQLEVGSTATSFDYRPYGTEDYLCKRYYQLQTVSTYGCIDGTSTVFNGTWIPKRATPTVAFTANFTVAGSGASVDGYGAYGNGTANNRNIFTVVSSAEL